MPENCDYGGEGIQTVWHKGAGNCIWWALKSWRRGYIRPWSAAGCIPTCFWGLPVCIFLQGFPFRLRSDTAGILSFVLCSPYVILSPKVGITFSWCAGIIGIIILGHSEFWRFSYCGFEPEKWALMHVKTGARGLPLQADSGDSGRAGSSGNPAGVYTPAMLAFPEQSPFRALHYWVQRDLIRL